MDNNSTSLIRKIIAKGSILTPFEAIHLKYLSKKGLIEQLVNIEQQSNPYTAAQDATGEISPYYVNFLVGRTAENDPDLYRKYNYAYEYLFDQDDNCEKLGYKGLMLLTQLVSMRQERSANILLGKVFALNDFQSYSYLHEKRVTYLEVLHTLGNTFRYFLKDIDNILTLNYYLNQLIDLDDLDCLRLLKMWLSCRQDYPHKGKPLPEASICCEDSNIEYLLNENHNNYVESLSRQLNNFPVSFSENSLDYVKDVLARITKSG